MRDTVSSKTQHVHEERDHEVMLMQVHKEVQYLYLIIHKVCIDSVIFPVCYCETALKQKELYK